MRLMLSFILLLCVSSQLFGVGAPSTLTIRGHIPWTNQESYTPVLIELESSIDDLIHLNVHSSGAKNIRANRSVEVKAGKKHTITVLLPTNLTALSNAQVNWSNKIGQKGSLKCRSDLRYRSTHVILFDRDASFTGNELLKNLPNTNHHRSVQPYVDRQMSSLPDFWQGIPQWICIILTPDAEKQITTSQIQALKQWHRAGGTIFVSTEFLQKTWRKRGVDAHVVNQVVNQSLLRSTVANLDRQTNKRIRQHRVPGTDEVPTAAFIIILLLFIAIAGPLNYWWVRRLQQIHLFLITTPIISSIFCLVLAIFGLLADGLSSHRSVIELTWLDQQHKQSCTWNSISWFSGLSPGDFSLSSDSDIRILNDTVYNTDMYDEIGLQCNWSTQQTVSGDWLLSRTHQQIQITTPRTEERRFLLTYNGNTPSLKNGFDRDIQSFVWTDQTGRRWIGENIVSGQSVALKPARSISDDTFAQHTRFDAGAQQIWINSDQALHFRASMITPIHDIPGPSANDPEAPLSLICGPLAPGVSP